MIFNTRPVFLEKARKDKSASLHSLRTSLVFSLCMLPGSSEPRLVVEFLSTQLLLSRASVSKLHKDVLQVKRYLHPYSPLEQLPPSVQDEILACASQTLSQKVRLISHSDRYSYPASIFAITKCVELTYEELWHLQIDVMCLEQDIETENAVCFYAEHFSIKGVCHLQAKEWQDPRGQTMCGAYPPPESTTIPYSMWFLSPCPSISVKNGDRTICEKCLHYWRSKHHG